MFALEDGPATFEECQHWRFTIYNMKNLIKEIMKPVTQSGPGSSLEDCARKIVEQAEALPKGIFDRDATTRLVELSTHGGSVKELKVLLMKIETGTSAPLQSCLKFQRAYSKKRHMCGLTTNVNHSTAKEASRVGGRWSHNVGTLEHACNTRRSAACRGATVLDSKSGGSAHVTDLRELNAALRQLTAALSDLELTASKLAKVRSSMYILRFESEHARHAMKRDKALDRLKAWLKRHTIRAPTSQQRDTEDENEMGANDHSRIVRALLVSLRHDVPVDVSKSIREQIEAQLLQLATQLHEVGVLVVDEKSVMINRRGEHVGRRRASCSSLSDGGASRSLRQQTPSEQEWASAGRNEDRTMPSLGNCGIRP